MKINQVQWIDKEITHSPNFRFDQRQWRRIGWSPPPLHVVKVNMEGSSVLIEVSFKDISATWELVLLSMPSFVLSYGSKCAGELNLPAVIFV